MHRWPLVHDRSELVHATPDDPLTFLIDHFTKIEQQNFMSTINVGKTPQNYQTLFCLTARSCRGALKGNCIPSGRPEAGQEGEPQGSRLAHAVHRSWRYPPALPPKKFFASELNLC